MKHTYIAAASSLVLTLALAGPAAAAGSGASAGTGVTGTGMSERATTSESATGMTGSTAKSESATGMTGSTATSGGKSVPSFSELDGDSKGHLTQQDLQDYPELQTRWEEIDVDKNDQIDQSEFSAFEAEWQKKQQEEGGSASKMDKSGMDKSGYKREQGGSAIQSD